MRSPAWTGKGFEEHAPMDRTLSVRRSDPLGQDQLAHVAADAGSVPPHPVSSPRSLYLFCTSTAGF